MTPLKKEPPFLAGQLHERPQVKELRSSGCVAVVFRSVVVVVVLLGYCRSFIVVFVVRVGVVVLAVLRSVVVVVVVLLCCCPSFLVFVVRVGVVV